MKKEKMRRGRVQKHMGGGFPFIPLIMLVARVGMLAYRAIRAARVGVRTAQVVRRAATVATRVRKVAKGARGASKGIKHVAKQSAKRQVKKHFKKQIKKKVKDRLKGELENQIEKRKKKTPSSSKLTRQVKKNNVVKLPAPQRRMIQMRMKQFAHSLSPVDSANSHRYSRNYMTWADGNTIQNRVKRT